MDLSTALILGAILSATDPVAVIALFQQLGAPKRLTVLLEGESLFNDATTIVLFMLLLGMAAAPGVETAADPGAAAIEFMRLVLGGAAIGTLSGVLAALLLRWLLRVALNLPDPVAAVPVAGVRLERRCRVNDFSLMPAGVPARRYRNRDSQYLPALP